MEEMYEHKYIKLEFVYGTKTSFVKFIFGSFV